MIGHGNNPRGASRKKDLTDRGVRKGGECLHGGGAKSLSLVRTWFWEEGHGAEKRRIAIHQKGG